MLITGSTGLVGSWLTKLLVKKGASVVSLVRDKDPRSEFFQSGMDQNVITIQGSLESFSTLERTIVDYEIDTVFHLAAQAIVGAAYKSPLDTFESNIRGTYNLLEACRLHQDQIKAFVVASSDKAYGTSEVLPYVENMPLAGSHPYDVSKSCTDLLSQTYFTTYQLPIAILRCGNIFGGGDLNLNRLIPGTIQAFYENRAPIIRSDGTFTRDYIYVEDAAEAYVLIAEHIENQKVVGNAFNFGPCQPYSVLEVVSALQVLMQKSEIKPKILNESKAEIKHQYLSSEKIHRLLGWSPKFSMEEGLLKTIDWYKELFEKENIRGKNAFLSKL